MDSKTFAIITDVHSNVESLKHAISIINDRNDIDQLICLGDCFALGPDPVNTLNILQSLSECIFVRGNHDRYLVLFRFSQNVFSIRRHTDNEAI